MLWVSGRIYSFIFCLVTLYTWMNVHAWMNGQKEENIGGWMYTRKDVYQDECIPGWIYTWKGVNLDKCIPGWKYIPGWIYLYTWMKVSWLSEMTGIWVSSAVSILQSSFHTPVILFNRTNIIYLKLLIQSIQENKINTGGPEKTNIVTNNYLQRRLKGGEGERPPWKN